MDRTDWLLVLGAGASAAAPCNLPVFKDLRDAAMRGLGWKQADVWDDRGEPSGKAWFRDGYPQVATSGRYEDVPAEVVFGAMHRFGFGFASAVERLTTENLRPNAIHHIAAALLRSGSPVWTPNIDTAVEQAHAERYGCAPHRVYGEGRLSAASGGPRCQDATNATLVKFHGSADVRESLAFADLELLTPLPQPDVDHLCSIAEGRRMVLYGYAGADADLRDLLAAAMSACREIVWFELNDHNRKAVSQSFPDARIEFLPRGPLPAELGLKIAAIASDFLALADERGLCAGIPAPLLQEFGIVNEFGSGAPQLALALPEPPGIVHARLIERFGDPQDEGRAISAARREDLLRLRPRAVRQHVRWAASRSLYGGGLLAGTTKTVMRMPWLLRAPGTRRVRDFVYAFGPALLLADGQYKQLHHLADRAVRDRRDRNGEPLPADLYYRAHALRYLMRLVDARKDASAA